MIYDETMRIETSKISNWSIAKKTKPIKAKPLASLLVDKSITSKFLVDTLEGKEPLGNGVVICVGEAEDVWQQSPKKLLQKYNVTNIDESGWLFCEPKPENLVDCVKIENVMSYPYAVTEPPDESMYKAHDFYVIGQWGETVEGFGKCIQWGDNGDYICRNQSDNSDVWIVRKKIFENTYSIL